MERLKTENIGDGVVLFAIVPVVGIFFLFFSCWIIGTAIEHGGFSVAKIVVALLFLVFGLGILQFTYLLASGKEKNRQIGTGVLYLASVAFMLLALVVFALETRNNYAEGIDALQYKAWAGWSLRLFGIGFAGFCLARSRTKNEPNRQATPERPVSQKKGEEHGTKRHYHH